MKIKFLTALLFSILLVHPIAAGVKWGPTGHRTVGEIVNHYLTSKAKREIIKTSTQRIFSLGINFW